MGEHMCEIPHITQHQDWISLKQTAVWYVLLWCCWEAACALSAFTHLFCALTSSVSV